MKIDRKREQHRKEMARYEMERMLRRYAEECGECLVRRATEKELEAEKDKAKKQPIAKTVDDG
ncbi:MAG: hypothetical protein HFJ85_00900 [Oscillospiraceae bacterium]|nr:hypothetical protein [Oscillospiraceae bacterium]